jgi:septal ring factor EnvC (AmiA/AmiB activator)
LKASATWIACVAASAGLLAGSLLHAEPATNPVQKLNDIEAQIRADREKAEQLNQNAQRFTRDQNLLRERLIQAAASAQSRERDLNTVEQRLAELETQEAAAMHALNDQRTKLASLLAMLQRMGREPPPALIVRPDDASAAARSAMLLSAVVPSAQVESRQLAVSLATLRKLRQQKADERLKVAALAAASEKDRNVLVLLLEQRRTLTEQAVQDLASTRQRIEAMGDQAKDIRALIASLTEDERRPQTHGSSLVVTNQIASAGAAKSVPLEQMRGRLKWPTNGALAGRFGAADGAGGKLAGIYLRTPPAATVTSPCDGKIMFAGPFRGYGQMLIISANGGYHVLLAGLTNIDGVVGQVVLAGEPLGRMGRERSGSQPNPQPGSAAVADGGRQLYIEFRRNDVPVDPVPWFTALKERVSG